MNAVVDKGLPLRRIRVGLRMKFAVLFGVLVATVLLFSVFWGYRTQIGQAEREMLGQTQLLAHEMDAVWDFMERNQDQFVRDPDGSYRLYCVVAAKSIARAFTKETDCVIHYTNTQTRKGADSPDAFEIEALETLRSDASLPAYWAMAKDTDGQAVFRYVEPLYITESCLECHGQPAGEVDIVGYQKEGLAIGDIAGVASIVMPAEDYVSNAWANALREGLTFGLVFVGGIGIIFFGLTRLVVNPLRKLEYATHEIEQQNFGVDVAGIGDRDEVADLSGHIKKMADQLQLFYEDLEDQVKSRTTELRETNLLLIEANEALESHRVRLERLNEALRDESKYKSDFLAIMSHELRTPLTSILAFIELWENSIESDNLEQRVMVEEIKDNGRILLQMINNILEMARVEAGKTTLNLEAVELADLFELTESTLDPLAKKRSIDLSFEVKPDTPIVYVDYEKLRRIVDNLVSNAIKFTQRGGHISVWACHDEEKGVTVIEVSDTGIGIKEEDIPIVFDAFTQVDHSTNRRYSGSGLGLAVVHELVDLHGGRIEVESVYHQGSTFRVLLPANNLGGDNEDTAC